MTAPGQCHASVMSARRMPRGGSGRGLSRAATGGSRSVPGLCTTRPRAPQNRWLSTAARTRGSRPAAGESHGGGMTSDEHPDSAAPHSAPAGPAALPAGPALTGSASADPAPGDPADASTPRLATLRRQIWRTRTARARNPRPRPPQAPALARLRRGSGWARPLPCWPSCRTCWAFTRAAAWSCWASRGPRNRVMPGLPLRPARPARCRARGGYRRPRLRGADPRGRSRPPS